MVCLGERNCVTASLASAVKELLVRLGIANARFLGKLFIGRGKFRQWQSYERIP
jgi:hypothetical protein